MGHQWMFDDAWVLKKSTSGEQREIKKTQVTASAAVTLLAMPQLKKNINAFSHRFTHISSHSNRNL